MAGMPSSSGRIAGPQAGVAGRGTGVPGDGARWRMGAGRPDRGSWPGGTCISPCPTPAPVLVRPGRAPYSTLSLASHSRPDRLQHRS